MRLDQLIFEHMKQSTFACRKLRLGSVEGRGDVTLLHLENVPRLMLTMQKMAREAERPHIAEKLRIAYAISSKHSSAH